MENEMWMEQQERAVLNEPAQDIENTYCSNCVEKLATTTDSHGQLICSDCELPE